MSRSLRWLPLPSLALAVLVGGGAVIGACTGNLGDPPDPVAHVTEDLCATGIHPGGAPIRRMTRFEYNNAVRDLLGDTTRPADTFVAEEEALGFNNQATALGVTQLLAEQYMEASESIAARAAKDWKKLLPCDPVKTGEDVCAAQFILAFGQKAFRRPLAQAESERLQQLYAWGKQQYDFSTGLQLVIQAALQSPRFLYRVEMGMPDPVKDQVDVTALDSWEIATRLSFLIWSSIPDAELFAAAEADALQDAAAIEKQARRMLEDPRARDAVANFHAQWLGLSRIETLDKDTAIYPSYTPSLRPLWEKETLSFLDHVVFDDKKGDVKTMLTAPYSMMNADLAAFYGVSGPEGAEFELVNLDPKQRSGLLTQASLLAVNAKPNQSSPIHRGKFVRERLLCQPLPPPPNNVNIQPPEVDPKATTRDKFSQHSSDPYCASCHKLMDPIGFGFESYDGIGQFRTKDHGFPVDATGELTGTRDSDGKFDGAIELAARLGDSAEVRECVATQWFRFGYGHGEEKADTCAMNRLQAAFRAADYNVKELLVALTRTDAFRYRNVVLAGK
jgi:uncharacterized protein DUF1592/uncharacterized protein DUF1588/uncharacterized protein DUF1595/uncharacterized protein DUF1587/uncharacterized protein DUF1585